MPYSYTNRQGKTHYFRAVETKTGKHRYYVTSSDNFEDLIEEVPLGFEVTELPEEAKVVIRKKKPLLVTQEEKEIVHDAIAEFSGIKDFFIHAEGPMLSVYQSQFSSTGGQEESLSREEAIKFYGPEIEKWMRFLTSLRFVLVDKEQRLFQTERMVYLSFFDHDFHPVGRPGQIEDVAREYGQHLGRVSFFDIVPNGFEE
ncbi:MAG: hypothetical protein R2788_06265 [Saprospiraceae bacterium]